MNFVAMQMLRGDRAKWLWRGVLHVPYVASELDFRRYYESDPKPDPRHPGCGHLVIASVLGKNDPVALG
jgi:hypothetical protein